MNAARKLILSPGVTDICQPMDASVVKADLYCQYHIDNQFPATPGGKRSLMSRIVATVWEAIPTSVIANSCIKAGLVPIGPRDRCCL
ncbi:Hypothetical protein PHPALM_13812 [Phytophthora palmivora]|uniref:DDE-1 domain-containing protein n=1 Tax=Phytophthora palmivora TaxID=4796 RepID=A0A2P4XWD6_9STRA|nr:Hypothetical protein PHPALM_13812 [Phytophthora palmivora]